MFVFIGTVPNTEFLQGALALDEEGWIITNSYLGTSQKGVLPPGMCAILSSGRWLRLWATEPLPRQRGALFGRPVKGENL